MSGRCSVVIVDDERPARAKLARLLAADDRFELVGEAEDGPSALGVIERLDPDLVVLDIALPGMSGFEVLDAIGPARRFAVVFSTAHAEHALRAFDAWAIDYLLKPFDAARLGRALDRASAQLGAASRPGAGVRRIVLRTGEGWIQPEVGSIVRLVAADKQVAVHMDGARVLVRESLRGLMARLEGAGFVRVHRTEVVNVDAIVSVDPLGHGDRLLTLRDGSVAVVSRTYRTEFDAAFFERRG